MSGVDTRNISRDSLFLMADVRFDGEGFDHRVKVRNLSSGGMMAEGEAAAVRGKNLSVNLRNIGAVPGIVAWVQEGRFGIAFAKEIDPKLARAPVGNGDLSAPRFTRPSSIDQSRASAASSNFRTI
ncbi:MAG: PilZ domain-containing protein [Pontixanthobacter sp.]